MAKLATLTWDGRNESGMIAVPFVQTDAVNLIARRMASAHYERENTNPNVIGHGAAVSQHLPETNPKEWERFKQEAINLIRTLYNSGARDFGQTGSNDPMSYFTAMHDLGKSLAV